MAVYNVTFDDYFYVSQTIRHSPTAQYVTHSWAASQTIKNNRKTAALVQKFNIYQTIGVRTSIKNLTVSQYLPYYQQGAPTEFQTVTQFLHMWQQAKVVEFEQVFQTLVINQSIGYTLSKGVKNTIVFTQTVSYTGVWNRTIFDTFIVSSSVNAYTGDKYGSAIALPTVTGPNAPLC